MKTILMHTRSFFAFFVFFVFIPFGCASGPANSHDVLEIPENSFPGPDIVADSRERDLNTIGDRDLFQDQRDAVHADLYRDPGHRGYDTFHGPGYDPGHVQDPCKGVSCSNHGHCVAQNNSPVCNCYSGYKQSGLNCVKEAPSGKVKILFDAGHGVTSGNADWVIDDNSPKPEPANPSVETNWSGGISRWAFELYRTGKYDIYNSDRHFTITYGGASQLDLKNFAVFVSCEPNHPYSGPEKKALVQFVKNGGRFILVIDHDGSDRDHDNWDSPKIAHDLFTNNGIQNNPFGITLPKTSRGYGANVSGKFRNLDQSSPVINGHFGKVRQINFHNGSYFNIDRSKGVQALGWQNASRGTTHVIAAVSQYGKGWFALVGDSSPVDDGTGGYHDKLYDGWDEADDGAFMLNLTDFMRTR